METHYWENARRKALSAEAKLVEIYLITNQNCGPSGAQICAQSTIAQYTGLSMEKVKQAINDLIAAQRIFFGPADWVLVYGKFKHEPTKTDQVNKAVSNDLECAPPEVLAAFQKKYPEVELTLNRPSSDPQATLCPTGNREQRTDTVKRKQKKDIPDASASDPKTNEAVKIWTDLNRELRDPDYRPTPVDCKQCQYAFRHLKKDLTEFEKRARNYLESTFVKMPTAAKFYGGIENYKDDHYDPNERISVG